MKKTFMTLLLLLLTLTGCIVEPGGDHGYRDGGRGDSYYQRDSNGGWGR
jgi:hypothetical protein